MLVNWENLKLCELNNQSKRMIGLDFAMIDQFNRILRGNIDYVEHLIDQLLELLSKYVPSDLLNKLSIDIYEKEDTSTYHYNYNLSQMSDKEVEEFVSSLRFYYATEFGITTNQLMLILPYTINDLGESNILNKLLQEKTNGCTSFSLDKYDKNIYHIPDLLTVFPDDLSNHRLKGDERSSLDIQTDQEEYQFIMQKRKGE
jgi:septum formation topological specificity factor MinE